MQKWIGKRRQVDDAHHQRFHVWKFFGGFSLICGFVAGELIASLCLALLDWYTFAGLIAEMGQSLILVWQADKKWTQKKLVALNKSIQRAKQRESLWKFISNPSPYKVNGLNWLNSSWNQFDITANSIPSSKNTTKSKTWNFPRFTRPSTVPSRKSLSSTICLKSFARPCSLINRLNQTIRWPCNPFSREEADAS